MSDDNPTFRRALEAFDIATFVRRHGGYKESASKHSLEYLVTCPACGSDRCRWRHGRSEREGTFAKKWVCWGCGRSGNSIDLIAALEKTDVVGAMDIVIDGYVGGDAITTLKPVQLAPAKAKVEKLPTIPWPQGVDQIANVPMHAKALAYIAGRGLDLATAQQWGLGVGRFGRLADYIVFPVYMDGGLVYWQGRALWDPPPPPPGLDAAQRKAWTKAWVRETQYQKSRNPIDLGSHASAAQALLNFDRARMSPHVVICEGPFDAIKVGDHAIALLGKVAQQDKIERILRMRAQRYTIYLDRGEQERKRAELLANELYQYAPTYIATPPEGYDPGALSRDQNAWVVDRAERWKGAQLHAL